MTPDELKIKHAKVGFRSDIVDYATEHRKVSIQFAIELLEELKQISLGELPDKIEDKINELEKLKV